MSARLPLALTVLLFCAYSGQAQVRISEIGLSGTDFEGAARWVELHNTGTEDVDVSNYFLCNFPVYDTIVGLTALSGSTVIPGGGYLVVAWPPLEDADSEVGLYINGTTDFADASSMVDYMQYGAAGHFRESTAVEAGVWEADAYVELPAEGQTLSLVPGGGGFAADWRAVNASPAATNPTLYRAILSGGNQTPALPSRAQGTVEGLLDGTILTVSGSFNDLESDFYVAAAGGAHIHEGLAGRGGGIEVALTTTIDLDSRDGMFEAENNALSLTGDQIALLEARKLYVNIHSTDHQGGEIRGQLLPATSEAYKAVLSGSAQVPANTSPGRGNVVVEIDGGTLIVTGGFSNLQSDYNANVLGGSHLHTGVAGQGGGIAIPLTPTLDGDNRGGVYEAADNTVELTEEQAEAIRQRGLYVNIHTMDHSGGEIRGQTMALSSTPFVATLSGAHVVPANASRGTGGVLAELSGHTLWVSGSFNGLEGAFNPNAAGGAHIHGGLAGQGGGIAIPLTTTLADDNLSGTFDVENNAAELTDEDIDALQARANYVNIHTAFLGSGEIRGQLLPQSSIPLRAAFTGRAGGSPNDTQGIGGAMLELNGTSLTVSGAFSKLSSPYRASHIHTGFIDEDGGVQHPLSPTLAADNMGGTFAAADNTIVLTEEQVTNLLDGQNYINIHSDTNRGGEIRGQILPSMYRVFEAYLSYDNEVIVSNGKRAAPGIAHITAQSGATGGTIALLNGTTLILAGGFSGLESDFNADIAGGAHVHNEAPNENGGIAFPLVTTLDMDNRGGAFEAARNTVDLTEEQVTALYEGQLYINVHSMDHPGGEVRGQLLASGNVAPNSPSITTPADASMIVVTGDPATPFEISWSGGDANADSVYYTWQLAADEAFETVLFDAGTGTTPGLALTYGDVASLLTAAGVALDGVVTLYHRAIATDGSFVSTGNTASVTLTRGAITSNEDPVSLPERFALQGNYPNPFNPTTTVLFDLPAAAEVRIEVHDVLGRRVLSVPARPMEAGPARELSIDASSLASGIYVYRVIAVMDHDTRIQSSRMTLVK